MSNAIAITPFEECCFLKIEYYKNNAAFYLKNFDIKTEDSYNDLIKMRNELLDSLINLPHLNPVKFDLNSKLILIHGDIKKKDKHLYNIRCKKEDPKKITILGSGAYGELMKKGQVRLTQSIAGVYQSKISIKDRIDGATNLAKELIDVLNSKIKEYDKLNRLDESFYNKKGINKELNIREHNDYYIEKGILYYRGVMDEFGRILVKKFKSKDKFKEIVDKLEHKVYFFNSSKYIQDSKISYQFKRYEKVIKDEEIETSKEDLFKINALIDEILFFANSAKEIN